MKYLFLLLLLPTVCLGQEEKVKNEKGDAHIYVKSTKTLLEVGKLLMEKDFQIDKLDSTLSYITTAPKQIPGINGEYYLHIVKNEYEYKVSGMWRYNFTASLAGVSPAKGPFEKASYAKARSNTGRKVFDIANEISASIGDFIRFSK